MKKELVALNTNMHVYVKLNETGIQILQQDHFLSTYRKPDEDGFYEFQLHEFMNHFGSHFKMGSDVPTIGNMVYFDKSEFETE